MLQDQLDEKDKDIEKWMLKQMDDVENSNNEEMFQRRLSQVSVPDVEQIHQSIEARSLTQPKNFDDSVEVNQEPKGGQRKSFFGRFSKKKFAEDDKIQPEQQIMIKEEPPISRKDSSKYDLTSDSEYEDNKL